MLMLIIKQLYVDGRFCYVYKIGLVTNGLGIVHHCDFYNKYYLESHPELIPNRKSDSPDEDKPIHDARLLIPTLKDFFKAHFLNKPKTFLSDAAFDSVSIYEQLLSGDTFDKTRHFSKAFIPLNERSKLRNPDYIVGPDGIPRCPKSSELSMKPEGTAKTKSGLTRYKFICPKNRWIYDSSVKKSHRECMCENPCTSSACGRIILFNSKAAIVPFLARIEGRKNGRTLTK